MTKKLVRKTHSPSFKFKVVLQYLQGDKTMSEISREFGVSPINIGKWIKIFRNNGHSIFDSCSKSSGSETSLEKEVSNLYKKIGELTVERDFLKKVLDA